MATYTPNLNLKKPASTDFYNIDDQNDNMSTIDTELPKCRILTGAVDPTGATAGVVGQLYLNTISKKMFQCMSISPYIWVLVEPYQIGETRQYIGADLGNKWALCNGAVFNPYNYTELSTKIAPTTNSQSVLPSGYVWSNLTLVNGYYVVCGYPSTGSAYPTIAYAINEYGPWTVEQLTTNYVTDAGTDSNGCQTKIVYGNGKYMVVSVESGGTIHSLYSTSITGNWTHNPVSSLYTGERTFGLMYGSGYFILAFLNSSQQVVLGYLQDAADAWSFNSTGISATYGYFGNNYTRLSYAGSYFFLTYVTGSYLECMYFTSPASTINHSSSWISTSNSLGGCSQVCYANGKYFLCVGYAPTTAWVTLIYGSGPGINNGNITISGNIVAFRPKMIIYDNATSKLTVLSVGDSNSASKVTCTWSGGTTVSDAASTGYSITGVYLSTSAVYNVSTDKWAMSNGLYILQSYYFLPTITVTGIYTYIKLSN